MVAFWNWLQYLENALNAAERTSDVHLLMLWAAN